jgi:hypothetical protein
MPVFQRSCKPEILHFLVRITKANLRYIEPISGGNMRECHGVVERITHYTKLRTKCRNDGLAYVYAEIGAISFFILFQERR